MFTILFSSVVVNARWKFETATVISKNNWQLLEGSLPLTTRHASANVLYKYETFFLFEHSRDEKVLGEGGRSCLLSHKQSVNQLSIESKIKRS